MVASFHSLIVVHFPSIVTSTIEAELSYNRPLAEKPDSTNSKEHMNKERNNVFLLNSIFKSDRPSDLV